MSNFNAFEFTSRKILLITLSALLISVFINLLASRHFSNKVSAELRQRDSELVYGAVSTGPLALAKLNSAFFAQDSLEKLLANPSLENSGVVGSRILGGPDSKEVFASWKSHRVVSMNCLATESRRYNFADSLYGFVIEIDQDVCFLPAEVRSLQKVFTALSVLQSVFVAALLFFSLLPVGISIRKAEKVLVGQDADASGVSYRPIRLLIENLLRVKQLEKDAALADLAANVAHDIRSPLSALRLVASVLERESEEKIDLLKRSIKRIDEIAASLLNPSRRVLQTSSKSIDDLLRESITEFELAHPSGSNLVVRTNLNCENLKVLMDDSSVLRLVSNLLTNAYEAMPNGGAINIQTTLESSCAIIRISDEGIGIAESVLKKIGEKGMTSGKPGGNGLGLWSAKAAVQEVGGRLSIESQVNQGTNVTVQLPLRS